MLFETLDMQSVFSMKTIRSKSSGTAFSEAVEPKRATSITPLASRISDTNFSMARCICFLLSVICNSLFIP